MLWVCVSSTSAAKPVSQLVSVLRNVPFTVHPGGG